MQKHITQQTLPHEQMSIIFAKKWIAALLIFVALDIVATCAACMCCGGIVSAAAASIAVAR
jgi:hypothetical protein